MIGMCLLQLLGSCSDTIGGDTPPPPIYPLLNQATRVTGESQSVEIDQLWIQGESQEIPIVFLREDRELSWEDFHQFENHSWYDLGDIFGGLDAVSYYREQGYDSYPSSRDFMFSYKWLSVTSYVDETDGKARLHIEVDRNTSSDSRIMHIHFYNGEWGLFSIIQDPVTKESQPE